ncbi:glycoside hydrolase family 105 protein [Paenibacillus lentus]|uniref:glycoside hydrolase family 88/105 protein n=1 Tax=Paenibacillus lentus TaxID=1338368 RepID=UPI00364B3D12
MFKQHENSIYERTGTDINSVLKALANRYVADQPAAPFSYRAFNREGIQRDNDFRYVFDLAERFPEAKVGQICYAWGMVWSDKAEAEMTWLATAWGPLEVFVNGRSIYRSLPQEERPKVNRECRALLSEGWNDIVLKFTKTRAGFGGRFGTTSSKWVIFNAIIASQERSGQEGWLFSEPLDEAVKELPQAGQSEYDGDGVLKWCPRPDWTDEQQLLTPMERLFGTAHGQTAFAWTKFHASRMEDRIYRITGNHLGPTTLFLDGEEVYHSEQPGKFEFKVELSFGSHQLMIRDTYGPSWGTTATVWSGDERVPFLPPVPVRGYTGAWLYIGSFDEARLPEVGELADLSRVHADGGEGTYWRGDLPGIWIRPYLEAPLFGKWNYPVGVTLYGLAETGRMLSRPDLVAYAAEHVAQAVKWYSYTKWDYDQYKATGINQSIADIDSLDDCGSFGSTMLEIYRDNKQMTDVESLAHEIGTYIREVQERLPDGAFYRKHSQGEHTMWADDLYMSVPFLCRYYQLTGEVRYIDDAARQFLLFRKYLYIPEEKLMSHVYDFEQGLATGVPWGRGNGWVLFSLSELLTYLPEQHPDREALLEMFRTLSAGYLVHQSEEGLWRQVINEPDAYLETSCTAMFIYAYARGLRNGWLTDRSAFTESTFRAWEGLTRHSIDVQGNLYGVCRGSGYSHSSHYYKYDLLPQLNDTHGIGIVMLAGVELLRLMEWMDTGVE